MNQENINREEIKKIKEEISKQKTRVFDLEFQVKLNNETLKEFKEITLKKIVVLLEENKELRKEIINKRK